MTPDKIVEVLVLLLSGGTLVKLIDLYVNRGRSLRDELRAEIARLEGRISSLETEVTHWKDRVDEWKARYYELLGDYQLLEVTVAAKEEIIKALEARLAALGVTTQREEKAEDGSGEGSRVSDRVRPHHRGSTRRSVRRDRTGGEQPAE